MTLLFKSARHQKIVKEREGFVLPDRRHNKLLSTLSFCLPGLSQSLRDARSLRQVPQSAPTSREARNLPEEQLHDAREARANLTFFHITEVFDENFAIWGLGEGPRALDSRYLFALSFLARTHLTVSPAVRGQLETGENLPACAHARIAGSHLNASQPADDQTKSKTREEI